MSAGPDSAARGAASSAASSTTVQVKICGVRRAADAEACAAARADYAGLNRVPGARRAIPDAAVPAVLLALGPVAPVWVYRDASAAAILADAARWPVRRVQLHGSEPPALGEALRDAGLSLIKATTLGELADEAWRARWSGLVDAFLVDGRSPGSGAAWAWGTLAALPREGTPVWLAGGLHPENVGAAIAAARPALVDVASGVEGADDRLPCPERIAAFVHAARTEVA